jgi:hypothetical protein
MLSVVEVIGMVGVVTKPSRVRCAYAAVAQSTHTPQAFHDAKPIAITAIPSRSGLNIQMSGVSGNLVPETLRGNDGNLIADPLVGLEVERELGVVTLDDDLGGLLDRLCSDTTHIGDFGM